MANDMMLAALRNQRATKMDPQPAPAPSRPGDDAGGLADRVSSLEQKVEAMMKMVGMEEKSEQEPPMRDGKGPHGPAMGMGKQMGKEKY